MVFCPNRQIQLLPVARGLPDTAADVVSSTARNACHASPLFRLDGKDPTADRVCPALQESLPMRHGPEISPPCRDSDTTMRGVIPTVQNVTP